MPSPPESTKASLSYRIHARARERWPALGGVNVRFRDTLAYIDGQLSDGTTQPLCRLRYGGYANQWASRSTLPAKVNTKSPTYPAEALPALQKKHSTAPAASTSTTQPRGTPTNTRRTYDADH
jgi:hypothetical protein